MTSPPTPPSRRNRRVVVTMAALVPILLWSWWFWPRGDSRFVGEWVVTGQSHVFTFRANGTSLSVREGDGGLLSTWRVDGDTLILRSDPPHWLRGSLVLIQEPLEFVTGCRINYGPEERFQIVDVTESAIQLRQDGDDGVVTLNRLSK